MDGSSSSVTDLLLQWRAGDGAALPRLVERVYPELRRLARMRFRGERQGHSLDPTGLVHEAYLRLVEQVRVDWKNRSQFYAMAATMMRRVLVEHARARQRHKRRGIHVSLGSLDLAAPIPDVEILELDRALTKLRADGYEMESQVVHLRFFAGLTTEEAAAHLGISVRTEGRAWRFARTWLYRELGGK